MGKPRLDHSRHRYARRMSNPPDFEARLSAVESRVHQLDADVTAAVSDAAAARHLAAARDRDLADLTIKVDANRAAINGLGVQTASRFDLVDQRFDQVGRRFDRVDRRFEQVDRRFEQIDRRFEELENEMRTGFAEMRSRFDHTAAGMAQIVELLTRDEQ
jgi:septation ring formation regulator EzrA